MLVLITLSGDVMETGRGQQVTGPITGHTRLQPQMQVKTASESKEQREHRKQTHNLQAEMEPRAASSR